MGIQGNENSFFTCYLKVVLNDSISHYFCGVEENNRINHLHEKALRIVYNDYKSTFENMLELDNSVFIQHRNIRLLSIELYKVKHNLTNQVISELFNLRNINYDVRLPGSIFLLI